MDPVYGILVLAPLAVFVAILYLFTRRRRTHRKVAPPVRPASSRPQSSSNPGSSGVATTWAPPAGAHATTGRHAGTTRAHVRAAPCADAGCAPTADAGGSASRPDLGIASGGTCCARGPRRRWMESTAIAFLGRRAAPGSAGPGHHRLGIAARQLPARGAACPFLERAGRRF